MPRPPGSTPAEARLHPHPSRAVSSNFVTAVVVAVLVGALLTYIALI